MALEIEVVTREGVTHSFSAEDGLSVMEVIRDSGIDELTAVCGGSCACATCHVYVEAGGEALAPVSSDEDELLDCSSHRIPASRLSCQIGTAGAGFLRVRIAPED